MLSELACLLCYPRLVHCRPGFDPRPTFSTMVHSGLFSKTSAKAQAMEQRALKNVNNCLNTNIYSYLEVSVG